MLESGSVSYGKATPWLPVIDLLKAYCRIESRDDERAIREKVTGKVLTLDRALEPSLPALLALLDAGEMPSIMPTMGPPTPTAPAPLPAAGEGSTTGLADGLPLSAPGRGAIHCARIHCARIHCARGG